MKGISQKRNQLQVKFAKLQTEETFVRDLNLSLKANASAIDNGDEEEAGATAVAEKRAERELQLEKLVKSKDRLIVELQRKISELMSSLPNS